MKFKLGLLLAAMLALWPSPVRAQVLPPTFGINAVSTGITDCASTNCATWQVPNTAPGVTMQLTGTMTSLTLTFEGSTDGVTWFTIGVRKLSDGTTVTTTTSTGQFSLNNTGLVGFRARCTTYASGGANVKLTRGAGVATGGSGPSFPASFTIGDLLYASAATTISGLGVGAAGTIVRSNGTLPVYSTATFADTYAAGTVLVASGANAVAGTACATGTVLVGGTPAACTLTPNVTGSVTVTKDAIATVSTDAVVLTNTTAATALATLQYSPRAKWCGAGWNTVGLASETDCWLSEVRPAAANPTTSQLFFSSSIAGGAFADKCSISSAGLMNCTNFSGTSFLASSQMNIATGGAFRSNGNGAKMEFPADGQVNFRNNAGTGFTTIQVNADIIYSYGAPVITSGFSTTAPSIAGKDSAFAVTVAATPGVTGLVTFGNTWTNVPSVNCTNTITANAIQSVPTTTNVVLNGVWVAGDVIRCVALGY